MEVKSGNNSTGAEKSKRLPPGLSDVINSHYGRTLVPKISVQKVLVSSGRSNVLTL